MDLAHTNRALTGFREEDWEPDIVAEGTCVGVVHKDDDCVAFAFSDELEILELEVDESFLTFTQEEQ